MLLHTQRLQAATGLDLKELSSASGLSTKSIHWMEQDGALPDRRSLRKIAAAARMSEAALAVRLGFIDDGILKNLQEGSSPEIKETTACPAPVFKNNFGKLFETDCLSLMADMESESVDLIFADPPFNLSKEYPSGMDDGLRDEEYMNWSISWLDECCRLLKYGGSIFIYNLPRWNFRYGDYLSRRLTFRHAISIKMAYSLPISGRLYLSHYSMLYLCKGTKPNNFSPDRLPMDTCPKCFGDLVDYGGYKAKMNPQGVNLMDVWTDIPPVRHSKYKKRKGANELSLKLLDRVIEMASAVGDHVFDPFGGSGTTYAVAEAKGRNWTGCELGPTEQIIDRLRNVDEEAEIIRKFRTKIDSLHSPETKRERIKRDIWTADSFRGNIQKSPQGILKLD